MKMKFYNAFILVLFIFFVGCATIHTTDKPIVTEASDRWVLLPFNNSTQTPGAASSTEEIMAALMMSIKNINLIRYRDEEDRSPLLLVNDDKLYKDALNWARQQGFKYGIHGSVNEWRYKAGLDGEPAVAITVYVVDVTTGKVIWSGTGARSGWGRESISTVAHKVLTKILDRLKLTRGEEKNL